MSRMSPWRKLIFCPRSCAYSPATASWGSERSKPTTPYPRLDSSTACCPLPHARSRTTPPLATASESSTKSTSCFTCDGVGGRMPRPKSSVNSSSHHGLARGFDVGGSNLGGCSACATARSEGGREALLRFGGGGGFRTSSSPSGSSSAPTGTVTSIENESVSPSETSTGSSSHARATSASGTSTAPSCGSGGAGCGTSGSMLVKISISGTESSAARADGGGGRELRCRGGGGGELRLRKLREGGELRYMASSAGAIEGKDRGVSGSSSSSFVKSMVRAGSGGRASEGTLGSGGGSGGARQGPGGGAPGGTGGRKR